MVIKSHPQRRYFWLLPIFLLIGLSLSFFPGYCWGLWGRGSLLLQYLFQCKCPAASEQARYPKQVKVIISACRNSFVDLSPSGRFLKVHEENSGTKLDYLIDLQTMERSVLTGGSFIFLTDDIGFRQHGLESNIVDRITGTQYSIKRFAHWREDAYQEGEPNLELLVATLRKAKRIILIQSWNTAVVLMSDFPENPEQNFTFERADIPGLDSNRLEQFLQKNSIAYWTVGIGYPDEAISPDGRFVARQDGIYLVETNQKIVTSNFVGAFGLHYLSVRGWTCDGTGVIYSAYSNPCLIDLGDDFGCYYEVPQPVIKLKVPEKYLLPQVTP